MTLDVKSIWRTPRALIFALVCATVFASGFLLWLISLNAALVTIDNSVSLTSAVHNGTSPSTVFISESVGYAFYIDSNGSCVYSKTTDGGANWGSAVTVDGQADCIKLSVWYDRWTPGDTTGTYIHVATIDTGDDDVWYTRVDTADDTISTPINITSGSGYAAASLVATANAVSITKMTTGRLLATTQETGDSIVVTCTTTCTTATNWTENSPTFTLGDDYPILVPLLSGNAMLIQWDTSADDVQSKVFNGTSWDANWVTIEANAADNTTYDMGFGAAINKRTGHVYLAVVDDSSTLGTDDDIKTWRYTSSWSATGDAVTNSSCAGVANCGITGVKIAVDEWSESVYVFYSARSTAATATTGNVYWKSSSNHMTSWGTEQGPLDTTNDDMYGARISLNGPRLYGTWNGATLDDLFGETILIPTMTVSTTSTQVANIAIGSTDEHIGGAFVFTHDVSSTTIQSITITETGTVDAAADLDNIKLFYDLDTSAPYDCASESYAGSETQYGSTDTNGFSGANGTSAFTGSLDVATSSSVCMYVVLDVTSGASDGETLDVEITTPTTDVTVSRGIISPSTTRALGGSTTLQSDVLTQIHYHFRNDDGSETTATSATSGNEDTNLTAYPVNGNKRIRIEVSNEGSLTSGSAQYRLEYGTVVTTCDAIASWTDVGAVGGDWDMFNSTNLTNAADTTNIAESAGGVTDENTTFLTPNGGVRDTGSQTGSLTLAATEFVELEYSVQASTTAAAGTTYCFRVSNAGTALSAYNTYPRATIAADVLVSVSGTQTVSTVIPDTDFYVGGAFVMTEQTSSRNVTGITITETGTVDAAADLDNIKLFYDLDTSAPYDCASESYSGSESQFGSTDTDGFSSANGTSAFTGSVGISTTATLCVYPVLDVLSTANNNDTLDIEISNSTTDVVVSGGGSTSPSAPRQISGDTALEAPLLTQIRSHWRNDDGGESAATSATGGVENTLLTGANKNETKRIRIEVSNEGSADSSGEEYRLEYGERITTCGAISSWIDVGASGGAFDMSDSLNVADGVNTTNISASLGGVTDENTTFKTPNGAFKDTGSQTGAIALSSTEFVELEYSIEPTDTATYGGTYCFRVTNAGIPIYDYNVYAIMVIESQRDYYIQRGVTTIASGQTTATITAGSDYTAPKSNSKAFIRITNTQHTGAGHNVGGGTQNASNVTTHMQDPDNLTTSVTFVRAGGTNTTRIAWEIVEYVGPDGGDNEMIVRIATTTTFTTTGLFATTSVPGVVTDSDVALFVTGASNPDTGATDYNTMLVTASWSGATDEAVLQRGEASGDAVVINFAAVEFTGSNWIVQRSEHTYTSAGVAETENITAVSATNRAFIHTQKRSGAALQGTDEFGHEVYLSSTSQVSYTLQTGATTPSGQTSVAWIIENTQTTGTPMLVTRSNGTQTGGAEPGIVNVNIGVTIADTSTASIFMNTRTSGTGTLYPRPMIAARIISTTQYEIWLSDTGATNTYRTEIVEWPTAERTLTQNYYRFYVDNDAIDPTDPWPVGGTNLGENTSITAVDDPLGPSERVRMRMSVTVLGANLTASTTAFKLQFGERTTTCTAISSWQDVGAVGSTTALWRGYDATPTGGASLSGNPPSVGDLNLSVSDRAGSFVESNPSPGNPHKVFIGEDVEYDWILERNIAPDFTTYCFRMVEYDGTEFQTYSFYPTLLTAGFEVESENWRWYDDETNETPTSALALENVAPSNIAFDNVLKLRVTALETGGGTGTNVKFKLQYSESSDFSSGVFDLKEIGDCTATSTWCYADGGGNDNATSSSTVLSDSDACVAGVGNGCGPHNESGISASSFVHEANAATEYEFTILQAGARVNVVYFFRMYDVVNDVPVSAASAYPSLVTEGAAITFSVSGLSSGTLTEGVTTDITTTATEIPFGALTLGVENEAAQRLSISTNATAGYRIFAFARQGFLSGLSEIDPVTGTNASPLNWSGGCVTTGCFGYHSGDDVLAGSSSRFAPNDTYAGFTSSLEEIAYSAVPVTGDITDVIYKTEVNTGQPAGQYSTNVVYIAVPVF